MDANQTDSLAIIAVFVSEAPTFGQQHTSYPKAISDLMSKAAELSSMELEETLDMNITLDQLITNIEWDNDQKMKWLDFQTFMYILVV